MHGLLQAVWEGLGGGLGVGSHNLLLLVYRGRRHSLLHQLNNFFLCNWPKPLGYALISDGDPLQGPTIYGCPIRHLTALHVKAEE